MARVDCRKVTLWRVQAIDESGDTTERLYSCQKKAQQEARQIRKQLKEGAESAVGIAHEMGFPHVMHPTTEGMVQIR